MWLQVNDEVRSGVGYKLSVVPIERSGVGYKLCVVPVERSGVGYKLSVVLGGRSGECSYVSNVSLSRQTEAIVTKRGMLFESLM